MPLLGQPDVGHELVMEGAHQHPELSHLQDPISPEEVAVAIKTTKRSTDGPDGISLETISSLPIHSLTRLFNFWLYTGKIPEPVALSRVTFIAKVLGSQNPSEYRPISVGCHLVRQLHKILSVRLQELPISKSQLAFRPVDGCAVNTSSILPREKPPM